MKLSGWCAPIFGTTESPRAHATCEDRIRRGLLTCDCDGHAESLSTEGDSSVEHGRIGQKSGPESALTDRGLATVSTLPKGA